MKSLTRFSILPASWLFLMILSQNGLSAAMPQSTQDMLKKMNLAPSLLSDIDRELQVPKDWPEKAKKEGKLRIISTWNPDEAKVLLAPFQERYPFIVIDHARGGTMEERDVKTLAAFKSGRILADVMTSVGGTFYMYRQLKAVEDLSSIPAVKRLPESAKAPDGLWVGTHTTYWCMGYNTNLVKKEELPKRWEDLLTDRQWRDGNLAIGNRPYLVGLPRWMVNGEESAKEFITKLFMEVKPQLRKEGMNALPELLAAGEFHAVIPVQESRLYQMSSKGAPVGFTCPEPVPVKVGDIIIMKGSPNLHAARLFINWILTKEGQIAQYVAGHRPPVHKELMRPEFIPFADQILGKKSHSWDPELENEVMPKLVEFWDGMWMRAGRAK